MSEDRTIIRFFVDAQGKPLGGYFGEAQPPAGAIEVPSAPPSPLHAWSGSEWVDDPARYRQRRAERYITDLAKPEEPSPSFMTTTGDTLDTVIAQVEAIRAAVGAARTTDFAAMLQKILAIKTELPKP
jgi:hypothetical protein